MGVYSEIFPNKASPKLSADKQAKINNKLEGGNTATVMPEGDEEIKANLLAMKGQLAARNIKLGDLVGAGDMGGMVYEVLGKNGKPIPSVVLRLDPVDTVPLPEKPNPAYIRPAFRETVGYYSATIVPMAVDKDFTKEQIAENFSALNNDGLLPHTTDLEHRQFMDVPGISMPVITDMGCHRAIAGQMSGIGSVEMFCGELGLSFDEVKNTKMPPERMAQLEREQEALHTKILMDLKAADINIDAVPTRQEGAKVEHGTGHDKRNATAKS